MKKVDKYIELILNRCLKLENTTSLFINCEKSLNADFVNKIVDKVKQKGIKDIYICDEASFKKHRLMQTKSIEELKEEKIFNSSIWDEYAKKESAFLLIESEIPGLMDDIDPDKIALVKKIDRNTRPIYRKKQSVNDISWCICAYPNDIWAKELFPKCRDAYNKLLNNILDLCMCNRVDPIKSWDKFLNKTNKRIKTLNDLRIEKLHYTNSLGTDLWLELPKESIWCGASNEKNMLVNMPSYEVFTSPFNIKTHGIVYSSKPLVYNGRVINNFWLKFSKGKVTEYDAGEGKDILKGIIESDRTSNMLGECAIVEHNSPISKTNIIFKTTLFDENASCHLALGTGFPECIKDYNKYSEQELIEMGVNKSTTHVDFMIGTSDLTITAISGGKEITIFKDGVFIIQ